MNTFVSIDWDFFIYNGELDMITLPDGKTLPGALVYDFGHSEQWGREIHDVAWSSRVGLFDSVGFNLMEEHGIRENKGCTPPGKFIDEMQTIFPELLTVPTHYSDSHMWAANWCRELYKQHGPLRVVSFDAHHDLGYGELSARDRKKNYAAHWGLVDSNYAGWNCGDWLFASLACDWVEEAVVVYPTWRGYKEWTDEFFREIPRAHLRKIRHRIEVVTYPELFKTVTTDNSLVANFIARSSGWTPPYLDPAFSTFVGCFQSTCFDCARRGQVGVHRYDNACKDRPFDYDEILEEERERYCVVEALRKAQTLFGAGKVKEAEEILKPFQDNGWKVELDRRSKIGTDWPVSKPVTDADWQELPDPRWGRGDDNG